MNYRIDRMKETTITDGVYIQKHNPKKFKIEIYKEKTTDENCMLAPYWVSEPPELWKKLNK